MIDPYFKSSDKVRELSGRVVLLSIFALFFEFYKINLEKIPFIDVPYPKIDAINSYVPTIPVMLFIGAAYFFAVMLGVFMGEYAEVEEKRFSELMSAAESGKLGPPDQDIPPDDQRFMSGLNEGRTRSRRLATTGAALRLTTDIVLPAISLGIAGYFEIANTVALFRKLLHL